MADKVTFGGHTVYEIGEFIDAAGRPTTVDPSTPVRRIELTDPQLGNFTEQSADQLSGRVVDTGIEGACQMQVDIDVDRGDGVKTITLVADLEFGPPLPGEAVSGRITFRELTETV